MKIYASASAFNSDPHPLHSFPNLMLGQVRKTENGAKPRITGIVGGPVEQLYAIAFASGQISPPFFSGTLPPSEQVQARIGRLDFEQAAELFAEQRLKQRKSYLRVAL
ncbi:hypothetical protein [Cohnella soli]|uniref:Uncharacterized protein n=1 Tax=Cohnella soli TaxID=425005 RepID=A0ABW0HXI0_9BACL